MAEDGIIHRLDQIESRVSNAAELYDERRRTDDARYERVIKAQDAILERVDGHGRRTTAIETKWEAFFGKQGAYGIILETLKNQDNKIDRLAWYIAIGIGLVVGIQFLIPFLFKR